MVGLKMIAGSALALPACLFLAGCAQESAQSDEMALPREETLYLSGQQWGTAQSFNPLSESWMATWPVSGRFNLMYEPLLTYNTLDGKTEPLLGTLVAELSNNDSIVVDLNPAAKWSDGTSVNSNDVKFIFTKGSVSTVEQIAAIHVDTLYEASTDTTVKDSSAKKMIGERLSFMVAKDKRNNPLSVMDLLQAIRIVPSHVFSALEEKYGSIAEVKKQMLDKNPLTGEAPVVSGPYNLKNYSSTKIVLERRDDYWGNAALHEGKLPAPKYIVHPIYKSNEHSTIALREGNLDASMSFIPRIERKTIAGVHTWYANPPYFVPGAMPMLFINTTKEPLNNKIFRRALATAIDYVAIKQFAVSKYTSDIRSGLIMPTSLEGEYINDEDVEKYGVKLNLRGAEREDAVKKMIEESGYKSVFNKDGSLSHMEDANGKKLPTLFITCPSGWTDWEAIVTIAVEGMRSAGIDIREGFVDGGSYWPAMGTGNFDLVMHKPSADVSPSLPWSRFNEVMGVARDWQPIGSWAGTNIGRYNKPGSPEYRPEVDSLLTEIPLMTDKAQKVEAYRTLNRIFMEDQPAIPLAYLPEQFYEFSDRVWTNWPTEKNPYAPPQLPWIASGTKILWNLKLNK